MWKFSDSIRGGSFCTKNICLQDGLIFCLFFQLWNLFLRPYNQIHIFYYFNELSIQLLMLICFSMFFHLNLYIWRHICFLFCSFIYTFTIRTWATAIAIERGKVGFWILIKNSVSFCFHFIFFHCSIIKNSKLLWCFFYYYSSSSS